MVVKNPGHETDHATPGSAVLYLNTLFMRSSLNVFGEYSITDLHLGGTGFEYRYGYWEIFTVFLAGLLSHSK
jgi:hypothetical protein